MQELILKSFEIRNFRGFKHLQIDRLGRVNLIAGKNNIGKSSLLEALQLYANNGTPTIIWKNLQARDESKPYRSRVERTNIESLLSELRHLFYGRKEIDRSIEPIVIGPINSPDDRLSISIGWYVRVVDEKDGIPKFQLVPPDEYDIVEDLTPRLIIQTGKSSKPYSLLRQEPGSLLRDIEIKVNYIAITPNGLDREMIGILWDSITLTELEKDVVDAMRIIAPGVERLSVVGNFDLRNQSVRSINDREREAIPILKVAGIDEPIALRSLGDGMQRIFGLALALVNAKNGMLLIDEIENGLHYSVQFDIWQFIFQLAHRLNVQVFATTHSQDTIKSFQEAAQENSEEEGLYIRLQSNKDEVNVVLYEEGDLTIATQEQLEVR